MVAVTGYGQAADHAAIVAAGFDRHLVKPVQSQLLSEVMASLRDHRRGTKDGEATRGRPRRAGRRSRK
jgi:two-component system CheB/CheR fusion protein